MTEPSSQQPLGQRMTGRRAQRRLKKVDNQVENCGKDESQLDPPKMSKIRTGPSEETERQIDAMIEQRRQTMQQSATNDCSYEEEPEILGTYEYLDHTADIQLHAWGETLENALEQLAVSMFGYMTSLSRIGVNQKHSEEFGTNVVANGHDIPSLVFGFLQEWLCIFHETGFVPKELSVRPINRETYSVQSSGLGEKADWNRHSQGTEIKAVTYSNLQVKEEDERCDIWAIVDI